MKKLAMLFALMCLVMVSCSSFRASSVCTDNSFAGLEMLGATGARVGIDDYALTAWGVKNAQQQFSYNNRSSGYNVTIINPSGKSFKLSDIDEFIDYLHFDKEREWKGVLVVAIRVDHIK